MFGLSSLLDIGAKGLELLGLKRRREDRADAESAGAAKQRAKDDQEALKRKDEQLKKATEHRPGDAGRALGDPDEPF